jgi:hypothetical protein
VDLIEQNRQQSEQIAQQTEQIAQQSDVITQQSEKIRLLLIRVDELANNMALLKEENQKLRDEIAVLKGQKPRPKIPPSILEGPKSKDKNPKISRGRHKRKRKKAFLEIHQKQVVQPVFVPEGATFKGYKTYDVQDIVFKSNNTRFLLARWQLPDGTYLSGDLPKGIYGHYGPDLIAYILNDYYACRVTEPLLLEKLHQRGILISAGQLNNILIQGNDVFIQEKNELLSAGIQARNQIKTDDTGTRHKGKNQYTNVIGNEWFSLFTTTDRKSRANFFRLLQNGKHEYLINEDALTYLAGLDARDHLSGYIALSKGAKFTNEKAWYEFLTSRNIVGKTEVRLITEAALFASAIENGIPRNLGVHSDDAGQFDAFIRSLCWIHEERHYRKIIPIDEKARKDLDKVRNRIWTIYKDLKTYQQAPNDAAKQAIEKQFDDMFLSLETSSPTLNHRLRLTHKKKQELLRVLERPDTPLNNNSSETDARSAVTKRKVSGSTRSDEGKDARDTFLSLKGIVAKFNFLKIKELRFIQKIANNLVQSKQAPEAGQKIGRFL